MPRAAFHDLGGPPAASRGFVVSLHATFGSPHLHCQTQLIQSAPPKPAQLLRSQEKGKKRKSKALLITKESLVPRR